MDAFNFHGFESSFVPIKESTASTAYVDLTTTEDTVTLTPGASGNVLVALSAQIYDPTTDDIGHMGFALSGGNTLSASDDRSIGARARTAGASANISSVFLLTGLTDSPTVLKAKYRAGSSSEVHFANRRIAVIHL